MEYTYERFLDALQETIVYSCNIRQLEIEDYEDAKNVTAKKIPKELQNTWETMLETRMSDSLWEIEELENVLECLEKIAQGEAPQEVMDYMRQYFEAAGKMYKADVEEDIISRNKAQYEMEALEDSMGFEGYRILGGFETFCNMAMEDELEAAEEETE